MNLYTVKINGKYVHIYAENGSEALDKAVKIAAYEKADGTDLPVEIPRLPDEIVTAKILNCVVAVLLATVIAGILYWGLKP